MLVVSLSSCNIVYFSLHAVGKEGARVRQLRKWRRAARAASEGPGLKLFLFSQIVLRPTPRPDAWSARATPEGQRLKLFLFNQIVFLATPRRDASFLRTVPQGPTTQACFIQV